jgi:hypothetical protein
MIIDLEKIKEVAIYDEFDLVILVLARIVIAKELDELGVEIELLKRVRCPTLESPASAKM